jgi:hypothetical protein
MMALVMLMLEMLGLAIWTWNVNSDVYVDVSVDARTNMKGLSNDYHQAKAVAASTTNAIDSKPTGPLASAPPLVAFVEPALCPIDVST